MISDWNRGLRDCGIQDLPPQSTTYPQTRWDAGEPRANTQDPEIRNPTPPGRGGVIPLLWSSTGWGVSLRAGNI